MGWLAIEAKEPTMFKHLDNPKFEASQIMFEAACAASRKHSEIAAAALAQYGDHGAQISGCVRDHFPEDVKRDLRYLAGEVTRCIELAYANRPKRAHKETLRHLGREVATKFGSGFYGPQPLRAA
jgi:hypothetical protein